MFNPFMPPEIRLDYIKFRVAVLCDGRHTLTEIKDVMENELEHSKEYVNMLVDGAINSFRNLCAVYWREDKLVNARDFGFFKGDNLKVENNSWRRQLSAPLFVIWEVTRACNLKCRHCLSDSGERHPDELNTIEAKKLIDYLAAMKVFNINFSGGEPLVRPDMFELLEYASGKNISIDLLTNGFLITKEVINRLESTNIFHVQVSLDGMEKMHDSFRGIKGSYERAVNAIKLLRGADYEVCVSSTVTRENIDEIPEVIDAVVDLGVSSYKTTLFMPAGRGKRNISELVLTPEDVKKFTFMMIEKKKKVGNKISISSETDYPWLAGDKGSKECYEGRTSPEVDDSLKIGCTAGNSSFYITPDGKITPCPFLSKFQAGDIRKKDIRDIWDNSQTFDIFRNISRKNLKGKCSSCKYLGVSCFGGCRAAAFAHTGDLYAEDPLCWKNIA